MSDSPCLNMPTDNAVSLAEELCIFCDGRLRRCGRRNRRWSMVVDENGYLYYKRKTSQIQAWVGDPHLLLHQLCLVNPDIISLDAYI